MKTYYELLGVPANAQAEEIKSAFRREISRYHPDKVEHLGAEFRELAANRSAQLTEAYRVLMDAPSRQTYDRTLTGAEGASAGPPFASVAAPPQSRPDQAAARADRRFEHERAATSDFVRRAAIARLHCALEGVQGAAFPVSIDGFDAAYLIKPRRSVFRTSEPQVRLLARFVPQVDGEAVQAAWPLAARSGSFEGVICLMLLGSGVSPARELAAAVADQRRRSRASTPVVVPVDVRDWEALFPADAPDVVRQVVQRLRSGS